MSFPQLVRNEGASHFYQIGAVEDKEFQEIALQILVSLKVKADDVWVVRHQEVGELEIRWKPKA